MKVGNPKKTLTVSVRLTIHHVSAPQLYGVVFLLELHKKSHWLGKKNLAIATNQIYI